jgi:hypothetical protein
LYERRTCRRSETTLRAGPGRHAAQSDGRPRRACGRTCSGSTRQSANGKRTSGAADRSWFHHRAYAVESLLVLSSPPQQRPFAEGVRPPFGSLEHARTCYTHLAGWLGVALTDALQRKGYLTPATGRAFAVTDSGRAWFEERGIPVPSSRIADPKLARQCPDWTERRPHLAGSLGVNMYRRLSKLGWIAPSRKSRAVRVTLEGREALLKHLGLVVG